MQMPENSRKIKTCQRFALHAVVQGIINTSRHKGVAKGAGRGHERAPEILKKLPNLKQPKPQEELVKLYTLDSESPIVTVKQGQLKGAVKKCLDGSPCYSFKGIRYGQPPVGELRFKAPLPAKPWEGILHAIQHGPVCPQFDIYNKNIIEGNEDCLFLNVYTKSLQPSSKIPVMVYIHAGGFMSGSGNAEMYGPEYLLQHNVVLVTMNYRLEALGFLCLDTPEVPGNAGIKDQALALRWVKENINKFGGDPDNITIFGESAGAGAVTYHMLSPMSKGLFNKAIAQSGVCLIYWSIAHQPVERAFRLGKLLGKDTSNPSELLDYLRTVPAIDLTRITLKVRSEDEKLRGSPIHFIPTVEKKFEGEEQFLTEDPIDLILAGKVNNVPLLIGYNSAEGICNVGDHLKKEMLYNKDPSFLVPRDIVTRVSAEKLQELGQRIKRFYVGQSDFNERNTQAIADVHTDINFLYQIHRFSHFYQKLAPTYLYRFDYTTELNILKGLFGCDSVKGACHGDDIYYLFYSDMTHNHYRKSEEIRKIIYQITKFWTNFARTGNPTPNKEVIDWRPYTSATKKCLILDHNLQLVSNIDKERVDFWNRIYSEVGLPCITKSYL